MYICDYKIRRETKLSHDKSEVRTQSEKQVQFGTRSHRKTQSRAQFEKDGLTKKLILLFTQEVHRYETFRISSLHAENTGTTHLGFLCFRQQVHRYAAFRVSSLHTGSTQVQSLLDFFPPDKKYTGTTPLGFLCSTQEVLQRAKRTNDRHFFDPIAQGLR
jgi:hypothetical protein